MVDLQDAFALLAHRLKTATPEAIDAARKAAADVYVRAARQAAPAKTGQLKKVSRLSKAARTLSANAVNTV